jgi:putative hydrolase of the HAD superfamily
MMNTENFRDCTTILFDFGGTLDSDGQHWLTRFFTLYDRAGFTIPRPEIANAFYYAVDTCYADAGVASFGLKPLVDYHVHLQFEALSIRDPLNEKHLADKFRSDCEFFLKDRLRLLTRMKTAYRLGIVSNFYGNLSTVLQEAQLSQFFEVIIDSNRVGLRKPDPQIFLLALNRLDLPGRQVIFVGDSFARDIVPATKTGMRAIWLKESNGPTVEDDQAAVPHDSISRLSDLEELVR